MQLRSGAVAQLRSGAVAQLRSGAVAQWRSGAVAQWRSGAVAQWRSGAVTQLSYVARASPPRLRGPGFGSCADGSDLGLVCFTLNFCSSLSCMNEYLAIDSCGYTIFAY